MSKPPSELQRKKLLEFASWLARRRGEFSIFDCYNCIAAWAVKWKNGACDGSHVSDLEKIFGLNYETAVDLYIGKTSAIDVFDITRMDAVRALRNVANGSSNIWDC